MSASPAYIFNRWSLKPVFHIAEPWGDHCVTEMPRDDSSVVISRRFATVCGRAIDEWGWTKLPDGNTDGYWQRSHATVLRRDHAELIGRICRRCDQ